MLNTQFKIYSDNLIKWNEVMNLTAITDEGEIEKLHFLDSLALLDYCDFKDKRVIDVGTGAGFPGLALRVAEPGMKLTLLDSLDKRIGFLKDTCDKLGISDVDCVHARAEEIPEGFRESFDIAVSRAVARLNVLAEMCLPYVREGGLFLAMKGPEFDEELEEAKPAIKALGGKCEKCVTYEIPGTEIRHSVLMIRKLSVTPEKYPRRWAQIKQSPLGAKNG